MHADRANRTLLTVIGFIALALGVGGLLLAAGVFGRRTQGRFLVDNEFSRYIGHHGTWVWPAIGGMALVVALFAMWWLGALLLTTDRASDIRLTPAGTKDQARQGRTTLAPSALVSAVTDEISDYHGITSARGRILGEASRPTLALDVSASRRADLPALIHRIQRDAVAHVRSVLDKDDMRAIVNVSVNDKSVSRTR